MKTTTRQKLSIESVRIEHVIDTDPDTSHLGTCSDDNSKAYSIVRIGSCAGKFIKELGEGDEWPERCREYRFFHPPHENYAGCSEEEIRKYCLQDWRRFESLNNGEWSFLGVIAKAVVRNPETGTCQTIRSGGLWGVESDSGEYLEEIGQEQLEELRVELLALGIGPRAINHAFKNVKTP